MSGPSRHDRTRPAELLGLAAGLALFVGVGVLIVTRNWLLAVGFFAAGFIASIVVMAMLMLAITPRSVDDDEPDDPDSRGH